MKNRKGILIIFLLLLITTLSGCFFASNNNDINDVVDDSMFVLDPNKEYKIEFMMWGADNEINNYSALIDSFMDLYPNITVTITTQDSTTYMSVLTGRLSGTMPDVFYLPEYDFRVWADSGRLLSISNGLTEEEKNSIWPTALDWYSYNRETKKLGISEGSNLYCLPKDIGPWTLMYNVDMIDEMVKNEKLTEDESNKLKDSSKALTWEEFTDICVKIQNYFGKEKNNDRFFAIPYYELSSAIWSNNADYFDENAMNSKINSDEFIETIEWLWDLMYTYKVCPKSTGDSAQNMFLSNNSVFCWVGPYLTPMYYQQKMNYRLIPVPYNGNNNNAKSTTWIGTLGLALSKTSKSPAASLALMKYLSINQDAQIDLTTRGQLLPNNKSLALDKNEFLSSTSNISKIWPINKELYCDIVDGFNGDTNNALNISGKDLIGGKVRPHYYTFENSWLNALEVEIGQIYALKDKTKIRQTILDYNSTMQSYLDRSNQSAGITN